MTLVTLAVKNVRHQKRNYAAFFLSSTFAVWLFYLYASLLAHPRFQADAVPAMVRSMLIFMEFVVALFSVLFILYAYAAFLKARKAELGQLTILGMAPRQVALTVHLEIAIVGLAAITAGAGLGTIFAKLFFMAISRVLDLPEPIPFHFSARATGLTYLVFAVIFGLISLYTQLTFGRLTVVELLRGAARPTPLPRLSPWRVILGLLALGTAYWSMLTHPTTNLEQNGARLLLLLLIGTYFLFTQGSVALLRVLRGHPAIYARSAGMLTVSQLVHKLPGNARILFVVSMLTTLVLYAVGTLFSLYGHGEQQAVSSDPTGIVLIGEPGGVTPDRTTAILRRHGLTVSAEAHLPALLATSPDLDDLDPYDDHPEQFLVISGAGLNQWLENMTQQPPVSIAPGRLAIHHTWGWPGGERTVRLRFGDQSVSLTAEGLQEHGVALNTFNSHRQTYFVAVLDDETFAGLRAQYGATRGTHLHGYGLPQWQHSTPAVAQLETEMGRPTSPFKIGWQWEGPFSATVRTFQVLRQDVGFLLFLGGFVGLLFFLAAGHMLYFKLFTDLSDDRRQFQALFKLGISLDEVGRIVGRQTLALFFAPLAVAAVHAAVAVNMVSRVEEISIWRPVLAVMAAYLVLQGCYYLVARWAYVRALLGPEGSRQA